MNSATLKQRLQDDMKSAMKAGDKPRLGVIRLMLASIKQIEVDTRGELTDDQIIATLDKMTKQRRESAAQYEAAGRDELAQQEQFEIGIIKDYLPAALTEDEISALIDEAISGTGAESVKDMGKVMGVLRPKLQGRADMAAVSAGIKRKLGAA